MAVPRWLKFLLPLFIFVAFFRSLIGAGELDLYKILVDLEDFEFDTSGIKSIISLFEKDPDGYKEFDPDEFEVEDFPMGDFPNADGSWDTLPGGGNIVLAASSPVATVLSCDEESGLVVVARYVWESISSFFSSIYTFFYGIWKTLQEVIRWFAHVFGFVFKVLGIA